MPANLYKVTPLMCAYWTSKPLKSDTTRSNSFFFEECQIISHKRTMKVNEKKQMEGYPLDSERTI